MSNLWVFEKLFPLRVAVSKTSAEVQVVVDFSWIELL